MKMELVCSMEKVMDLKGGENGHLGAQLYVAVDPDGQSIGKVLYSPAEDLGQRARLPGWTNIGDISACLRTSVGLHDVYKDSETPYLAFASKHTRPVIAAKGKTQLDAVVKAVAGDVNSPFGGVWSFNTELEYETAQFLDKVFLEAVVAPSYENGAAELLKDSSEVGGHANRFLIRLGNVTPADIDPLGYSLQPVAQGNYLKQEREKAFNVKEEAVLVRRKKDEDSNVAQLGEQLLDDIEFAGNVAIYLSSNLVFYVHDGAIAGLGDGCGARVVAARKARGMLEDSVYAALSADREDEWDRVLYDTPFTREDFEGRIKTPLNLVALSDAFFPKPDGFVETSGIDRVNPKFEAREFTYAKGKKIFIPKRNNFDPDYDPALIPKVVVQPGGSEGDLLVKRMARESNIPMVFTMTPEQYETYRHKKKDSETGKKIKVTGRRFFGHIIM